jgi:Tol biopolymer transport system component
MDDTSSSQSPARPTTEPVIPAPAATQDDIRISRKVMRTGGVVAAILALTLILWQLNTFNTVLDIIQPARATVTITNLRTQAAINQATVAVNQHTAITNTTGVATFTRLKPGETTFSVSATDYKTKQEMVTLKRGDNTLTIQVAPLVDIITLKGVVKDAISDTPLGGVTVTTKDGKAVTDADGIFSIPNVHAEAIEVTLEKAGYEKTTKKIDQEDTNPQLTFAPTGRIVFVSNRENGKRGVYTIKYDGSDSKALVKRSEETEDFEAILSPDGTKVAFLSTREKRRHDNDAQFEPSLYLVNIDGTNLTQLSKEFSLSNLIWSNNSRYVAWSSRATTNDTASHVFVYDTDKKQTTKITDGGSTYTFVFNHTATAIAWSQNLEPSQSNNSNPNKNNVGVYYRNLTTNQTKKLDDASSYTVSFTPNDEAIQFDYFDSTESKEKHIEVTLADASKKTFTPSNTYEATKVPSFDKKLVAYIDSRDGKSDVFVSNPDGTNERQITTMGTAMGVPAWDPSDRYLVFDSSKEAETARYIVGVNGKSAKKITDIYYDGYRGF